MAKEYLVLELIKTVETKTVLLWFFALAQRLHMKRAGAVVENKYLSLERSGRRFEPI
ncbi:hypothetical protein [Lapidilactobacillus bayanensis]|uniref:hypothetical protein n=1 Tax=Lapidilactobacillus bayanensis TaxID=2485998 RepID=UPI0013DE7519|nr:hypothetical protein [Lapidilactobacillus bayanensis]